MTIEELSIGLLAWASAGMARFNTLLPPPASAQSRRSRV